MTTMLDRFTAVARENPAEDVTYSLDGDLINKGTLGERTAEFFRNIKEVIDFFPSKGEKVIDFIFGSKPKANPSYAKVLQQQRAIERFSEALTREYGTCVASQVLQEYSIRPGQGRLKGQMILDVDTRAKEVRGEFEKKNAQTRLFKQAASKALGEVIDTCRMELKCQESNYGKYLDRIVRGSVGACIRMKAAEIEREFPGRSSKSEIYEAMLEAFPGLAGSKGLDWQESGAIREILAPASQSRPTSQQQQQQQQPMPGRRP